MTATEIPSKPAGFYVTGGTLTASAPSYIERRADGELLSALNRGEFCYVLNARQMGKSSLMTRTAVRLRRQGHSVAILDLTEFGKDLSQEQWYYGMLRKIGRETGLFEPLVEFWKANKDLSPLLRLMEALREIALPAPAEGEVSRKDAKAQREEGEKEEQKSVGALLAAPSSELQNAPTPQRPDTSTPYSLIIFVDEIDFVRSLPFSADEFFAGIRECYTRRANDPRYNHLTFCLLGVATPADLIRDPRTTPFNVGTRIELTDFTPEEAAPLAEGLVSRKDAKAQREGKREEGREEDRRIETLSTVVMVSEGHKAAGSTAKEFIPSHPPPSHSEGKRLLERVLYWTGGHPFLTQRLCRAIVQLAEQAADFIPTPQRPNTLTPQDVDALCADLFFSHKARTTDDNLAVVAQRLLASGADIADLLTLYGEVRNSRKGIPYQEADPLAGVLRLSGIVRADEGRLKMRNRIYDHVFDRQWIKENMPDAELKRQNAARQKGFLHAALLFGAIAGVIGALGWVAAWTAKKNANLAGQLRQTNGKLSKALEKARSAETVANVKTQETRDIAEKRRIALDERKQALNDALKQKGLAEDSARKEKLAANAARIAGTHATYEATHAHAAETNARKETQRANRYLYIANMNLIQQAWEATPIQVERVLDLLEETRSSTESGFEWFYWNRLCHMDMMTFKGHTQVVSSASFSPDGKRIVTGSQDATAKVWDVQTGKETLTLKGHEASVTSVSFSPDGKHIVTGSADKTAKVWDAQTGKETLTLKGHGNAVTSVSFSPDGKRIVTVSWDGTVKMWLSDKKNEPDWEAVAKNETVRDHH